MCLVVVRVLKRDPYCYNQNCGCFYSLRLKKQMFWHNVAFTFIHSKYERMWKIAYPTSLYLYDTQTLCLLKNNTFELISWERVCLRAVVAHSPDQQISPLNTFAASYLNTQGPNNSCLKSPASTLVGLTFQSRALRSFSLNQLHNLSL